MLEPGVHAAFLGYLVVSHHRHHRLLEVLGLHVAAWSLALLILGPLEVDGLCRLCTLAEDIAWGVGLLKVGSKAGTWLVGHELKSATRSLGHLHSHESALIYLVLVIT